MSGGLEDLQFENRFTSELPADPDLANHPRQVEGACYSRVLPRMASEPQLIACSVEMASLVGLSSKSCLSKDFAKVFSGAKLLDGMDCHAACYGGHQFGNWAGQLGDGRAINLGEVKDVLGGRQFLQLKGAGPTPYSRTADGLAVLRSSVREFLCSEAMYHLGVPTTRAMSLVLTGDQVMRDMFYDGHPKLERGAVVCRVAPSFTRFGNFEIFASRGDYENLKRLVDYTIREDFSHLGKPCEETYLKWFEEVCDSTARMIVHWMQVGFVHGVMNTDNMSILGLTIDYGPYGWLEDYNPGWTPNTTDSQNRRYRFGQQSEVAHWNLMQLARAISPLFESIEPLQRALDQYPNNYQNKWEAMMAWKLGLIQFDPELFAELNEVLQLLETDMTLFFRNLARVPSVEEEDDDKLIEPLLVSYYSPGELTAAKKSRIVAWLRKYQRHLRRDCVSDEERKEDMNRVNPKYVLRNYMAQLAIDQADKGDFALVGELLELLRHPYDEQAKGERWAAKRPEWARTRAGCSMLSCSS